MYLFLLTGIQYIFIKNTNDNELRLILRIRLMKNAHISNARRSHNHSK